MWRGGVAAVGASRRAGVRPVALIDARLAAALADAAETRPPARKRRRKAPFVRECFDNVPSGVRISPEQGLRT